MTTAKPVAAAVQLVDDCVRRADPQPFRGELVAVRSGSTGVWTQFADQQNVVRMFIPREVLKKEELREDQLLEVWAVPAVSKSDKCDWYLKVKRFTVVEERGPLAARRRRELQDLSARGVIAQKRIDHFSFSESWQVHDWPDVRKVVVLTSTDAAGWQDFKARAQRLFDAGLVEQRVVPMQGQNMVRELAIELANIRAEEADLVFIVRGGGGWADLRRFDDPLLAHAIAACTVNVVTAVGHHKDRSVADYAAFAAFRTPTDAAAALDRAVYRQRRQSAGAGGGRRSSTSRSRPRPTDPASSTARSSAPGGEHALNAALDAERVRANRLRAEVIELQRQLDRSQQEYGALWQFTRDQLFQQCVARVRRRRWVPALGLWLVGFCSFWILQGSPMAVAAGLGILGIMAVAGVYVFCGPWRATRTPSARLQQRAPANTRAWVELALRARTPRELQLLQSRQP